MYSNNASKFATFIVIKVGEQFADSSFNEVWNMFEVRKLGNARGRPTLNLETSKILYNAGVFFTQVHNLMDKVTSCMYMAQLEI